MVVMLFHTNLGGSPTLLTTHTAAREWLHEKDANRLDTDQVERPNTRWVFQRWVQVEVTGCAIKKGMYSLDTFDDNMCLFRCIAVHRGAENAGWKGDRGAPWSYWCHRLVAPQDCGLGCCLACGTPVGSGSRFGRRGCGLLSPEVYIMAEPIAATVRRVFVLSWLGRSSSSATDAYVSSFCASAGFSVCDSHRCEVCDKVTIDGLSVELAIVNGSFSACSLLFCPGAMSFVATRISLLYPEMCAESRVNVTSDGHM